MLSVISHFIGHFLQYLSAICDTSCLICIQFTFCILSICCFLSQMKQKKIYINRPSLASICGNCKEKTVIEISWNRLLRFQLIWTFIIYLKFLVGNFSFGEILNILFFFIHVSSLKPNFSMFKTNVEMNENENGVEIRSNGVKFFKTCNTFKIISDPI